VDEGTSRRIPAACGHEDGSLFLAAAAKAGKPKVRAGLDSVFIGHCLWVLTRTARILVQRTKVPFNTLVVPVHPGDRSCFHDRDSSSCLVRSIFPSRRIQLRRVSQALSRQPTLARTIRDPTFE